MARRVVLQDIATKLGLSKNSVSRALRDCDDIGEETKIAVKKTALEMGYIPNALSTFLRESSSKLIGIVTCDLINPYYSMHIDKIIKKLRSLGFMAITILTDSGFVDLEIYKSLLNYQVSAIISFQDLLPETHDLLMKSDYPLFLYGLLSQFPDVPSVYTDDEMGGELVAEECLREGKKKPAYVCWAEIDTALRREQGFEKGFKKKKIVPEKFVVGYGDDEKYAPVATSGSDFIFAYCDSLGIDLKEFLDKKGCHPQIYGFDGLNAQVGATKSLPSVSADLEGMVDYLCQEIVHCLSEPTYHLHSRKFPVHLTSAH
jgi:LacI family transcriptional regulator